MDMDFRFKPQKNMETPFFVDVEIDTHLERDFLEL